MPAWSSAQGSSGESIHAGTRAGATRSHGAKGVKTGSGARAKVVDNTSPISPGGGAAAMRSPTGPEKDSASSTKGLSCGSSARACDSSMA